MSLYFMIQWSIKYVFIFLRICVCSQNFRAYNDTNSIAEIATASNEIESLQ